MSTTDIEGLRARLFAAIDGVRLAQREGVAA